MDSQLPTSLNYEHSELHTHCCFFRLQRGPTFLGGGGHSQPHPREFDPGLLTRERYGFPLNRAQAHRMTVQAHIHINKTRESFLSHVTWNPQANTQTHALLLHSLPSCLLHLP